MRKKKISAVIVAGGKGRRMGKFTPKQFLKINEIPIIVRTLLHFEESDEIDNIVLVLPNKWKKKGKYLINKYSIRKVMKIVTAGRTRQVSVYNGLIALKKHNPDIVLIHDGARPLVTKELIKACCKGAKKYGAVSFSIKPTNTLFDRRRKITLDRKNIISIQTPQAFKYKLIMDAHIRARKKNRLDFPDDTTLLLSCGTKTVFIEGEKRNIKITDKQDLCLARAIVNTP